jgi:hypothetical protein
VYLPEIMPEDRRYAREKFPDKTIREKQLIAQAHAIVRELNIGSITAPTRQRLSVVARNTKKPPALRIVVPDAPADDG